MPSDLKSISFTWFAYLNRKEFCLDPFTIEKIAVAESHLLWHMTLDPRIGAGMDAKPNFQLFIATYKDLDAVLIANAKMIVCNHPTFS